MSSNLKAALVLGFEDHLTAGLNKLKSQLDGLKTLGREMSLGKLENAGDALRRAAQEARGLQGAIRGVEGTADRAWSALRRMGSAARSSWTNWKKQAEAHGRLGALEAAGAGISVMAPLNAYAGYENTLRHVAITEKKSGPAVEAEVTRLDRNMRHEALTYAQDSRGLSRAYNFLITTGMKAELVDKLMPAHAKAATAYNIDPDAMGQAVYALADSFKIGHEAMPEALAAMAYAAKEGHFSVEAFSHFLPQIGGQMALMGMGGRKGADIAFAGLETVIKNSADPGTAATNFSDLLRYITSPIAVRSFAKQGIDLPGMLKAAEKQGVNPLDAVLGKLASRVQGKSEVEGALTLGQLLHNQQAGTAAMSLIAHRKEFMELREMLSRVDKGTIDTDFITAMRAPAVQMRLMSEELEQLERRMGKGFVPVLQLVNILLLRLLHGIEWLDEKFPGLGDAVLAVVGGFLGLTAVAGALGVALPAIKTGFVVLAPVFRLLLGPLRLLGMALAGIESMLIGLGVPAALATALVAALAVALAAAAYDIIANWERFRGFFAEMWAGIQDVFGGFYEFLAGIFTGDLSRAVGGLKRMWQGLEEFFSGLWGTVRQLFDDFVVWVDGWTGGLGTATLNGLKAAWGSVTQWFSDEIAIWEKRLEAFAQKIPTFFRQHANDASDEAAAEAGLPPPDAVAPAGNGHVVVQFQNEPKGTQVRTQGNVTVQRDPTARPDMGRVLNRD